MQNSGNDTVQRAWTYLEDRFGVAEDSPVLDGLVLKEVSEDIWLTAETHETAMEVKTYGIRFIRIQDIGLKPTTYALQLLGDTITKNVVELPQHDFIALLEGENVTVWDAEGLTRGYAALKCNGRIMGCGMYQNSTVSSRIPKGRGKELIRYLG